MKHLVIIKHVIEEEFEMVLENETTMGALDEARRLVAARNEKSKLGRYSVIKIKTIKEE